MTVTINARPPKVQRIKREHVAPTGTVIARTIKADTYMVLADSQREIEDEFTNLYFTAQTTNNALLEPPFNPRQIARLPALNNTLYQCVEAMEVNIDGTGHDFEGIDGAKPDDTEVTTLESFFNEPYPGESFVSIRRELRRQMESVGWAFLEVLVNPEGLPVGMRNVVSRDVRLVKLDTAVQVTKPLMRNGKDTPITYWDRERRFAMIIGSGRKLEYFREFGTTRELHKLTGQWETKAAPVPLDMRASLLLYFDVNKDTDTQYGLPRWINQMPSILGSRKAEEQNLEFFDAGGVPPAIIFLKGGALAKGMDTTLKLMLSGQTASRNRILVATVQAVSGGLDSSPTCDVQVERFGSGSVDDAMYANYDQRAADHVLGGFRLPKLFLGRAEGLNFATAYVSYMVADAQVFQPERTEFDEITNRTIVKALGCTKTRFKSKGISLKNVDAQLAALGLIGPKITSESMVEQANSITGLNAEFDKAADDLNKANAAAGAAAAAAQGKNPDAAPTIGANGGTSATIARNPGGANPTLKDEPLAPAESKRTTADILKLASDYCRMNGLNGGKFMVSKAERERVELEIKNLGPGYEPMFLQLVNSMTYGSDDRSTLQLIREHVHAH